MLTPSRQSCPRSAPDPSGQTRTAFLKTLSHPSSLEALNSWHMVEATTLEGRSGPALVWHPGEMAPSPQDTGR